MSGNMDSEIFLENGIYYIKGKIDEHFDSTTITGSSESSITIDLSLLKAMNSVGIKNWIFMLTSIEDKEVHLRKVPFFFVDQLLMISELIGQCKIESLELPFFCEKCDKEQLIVFKAEDIINDGFPSDMKCTNDGCGESLDFDEDEDSIIDLLKGEE